jgi:hypothetical protein
MCLLHAKLGQSPHFIGFASVFLVHALATRR